jgi:hypothetical protein
MPLERDMTNLVTDPNADPLPQKMSDFEIWRLALTRPNESAYERIYNDPDATLGRAIAWIAISSGAAYIIGALAQLLIFQLLPLSSFMEGAEDVFAGELISGMSTTFILACGLPVSILMSTLGILIFSGLLHFIAGALGGNGSFERLVYTLAAISAPGSIISALLSIIPLVNCLTIPLALYMFVLNILAVKVAHNLSWGTAMGSMLTLIILFILIAVVIGLALWSPLQDFMRSPEFLPSEIY